MEFTANYELQVNGKIWEVMAYADDAIVQDLSPCALVRREEWENESDFSYSWDGEKVLCHGEPVANWELRTPEQMPV